MIIYACDIDEDNSARSSDLMVVGVLLWIK